MDTKVFYWTLFGTKCPKYVQISLKYGHFLDTSSSVGHILDMNWTLFAKRCPKSLVWTLLWTHFGHLEQKCVQKVSVPTSFRSTPSSNAYRRGERAKLVTRMRRIHRNPSRQRKDLTDDLDEAAGAKGVAQEGRDGKPRE